MVCRKKKAPMISLEDIMSVHIAIFFPDAVKTQKHGDFQFLKFVNFVYLQRHLGKNLLWC